MPEAPEARVAEAKVAALDPESEQEQIREAVVSKTEVQQLLVALEVKPAVGQGETREISLSAHLDVASLHFRKEAEHNLNTVTFVFAVFDEKDSLVNAQHKEGQGERPRRSVARLR